MESQEKIYINFTDFLKTIDSYKPVEFLLNGIKFEVRKDYATEYYIVSKYYKLNSKVADVQTSVISLIYLRNILIREGVVFE